MDLQQPVWNSDSLRSPVTPQIGKSFWATDMCSCSLCKWDTCLCFKRHVKRKKMSTVHQGSPQRWSEAIPNLLSCTVSRLKQGNGYSPFYRAAKPQDYTSEVNEKKLQKYTPQRTWPWTFPWAPLNHFVVKVYLLCRKSSKPRDIFMTFQSHPKPQAQEKVRYPVLYAAGKQLCVCTDPSACLKRRHKRAGPNICMSSC